MKTPVALALVLFLAAGASAAPVLDGVTSVKTKTRGLVVSVESTLTAAGDVTLTGDVGGKSVTMKKRLQK